MALTARVLGYVRRHGMFQRGARVAVAVSGGVDSVVLLDVLHSLRRALGIELVVAHLDHGLRPGSAADSRFVRQLARGMGLPFYCGRVRMAKGKGTEDAARLERRAFLLGIPAHLVATGHHGDDQAETVLLRGLRGSGARGLAAMEPVRLPFVRPLLAETRRSLREYARGRGLSWREDPSNSSMDYERNKVRHKVIPLLDSVHGGAAARLRALSDILRADADYLDAVAARALAAAHEPGGLSLERLRPLPPPILFRVLQRFVGESLGVGSAGAQLQRALDLVNGARPGAYLELPRAWRLALGEDLLYLLPPRPSGRSLEPGCRMLWGAYLVEYGALEGSSGEARVGAGSVVIRAPRKGERVGGRRLAEMLRASGIPAPLRPYHPVLRLDEQRLWIPPLGLFHGREGFRAGGETAAGRWSIRLRSYHGRACRGADWCITL